MSALASDSVPRPNRKAVTGLVPPLVTPLLNGSLDFDSLRRFLDALTPWVSGVLVGGSVGEVPSLTVDERMLMFQRVRDHIGTESVLCVSIADNSIENTRMLAKAAEEVGADLAVVSPPGYFRNSPRMLRAYFAEIGQFTNVDLCLYDNPVATGTELSVDDIALIAEAVPSLTHVKVTDTDLDKVEALLACPTLSVLSGEDVVLWHQLRRGAAGAMVALPMIFPKLTAEFWTAFVADDLAAAALIYRKLIPFIHLALGASDYVAVIKTALHEQGLLASPEVRLPLMAPTARRRDEVVAVLNAAASERSAES